MSSHGLEDERKACARKREKEGIAKDGAEVLLVSACRKGQAQCIEIRSTAKKNEERGGKENGGGKCASNAPNIPQI